MGQIEYDSILPFPHLGNKDRLPEDRTIRDRVIAIILNPQISPPKALRLLALIRKVI
jgi:hypothetical protein